MEVFFPMFQESKEFQNDEYKECYIDIQTVFDNRNDEDDTSLNNKNIFEVDRNLVRGEKRKENINNQNGLSNNNESFHKKPTLISSQFENEDFASTGHKTILNIKEPLNIKKKELQKSELLNKKRNISNNKGIRKDNILNRIKSNFFIDIQKILSNLFEKTELYRTKYIIFNRLENFIYKEQKALKNLNLFNSKLKDVLSKDNRNKAIIDNIIEAQDYPLLIEFLNKTIRELIFFYSDNCKKTEVKEQYYLDIMKSYDNLIKKLEKEGKTEEYISKFRFYSSYIEEEFIEMNKHKKEKKNN